MMKVVLVEDDDMLRKSLAFFLKANHLDVEEFDNGMDAIEFINGNVSNIKLVITDLNLPFAGGKQVIHACKSIVKPALNVVVLTSLSVETTEVEMFELGADDFIAKPFSPQVLLKRIQKVIS